MLKHQEVLNIQFHVVEVQGLGKPTNGITRYLARRFVHVECRGTRNFTANTDLTKGDATWNENLPQMGPLIGTEELTFAVKQRPWSMKTPGIAIASSEPCTVNHLLVLQGKQGSEKGIKIPLQSHLDEKTTFQLVLYVRQPSSKKIAEQWIAKAKELHQRKQQEEGDLDMQPVSA